MKKLAKKTLRVYASAGGTYGVGWSRDDLPMIHLFANVPPGQTFRPTDGHGSPHWPCAVCDAHRYTEQDFHDQVIEALARGPS